METIAEVMNGEIFCKSGYVVTPKGNVIPITDNTKILEHTGLKQSDLMGLKEGLKYEYERSKDFDWNKFANDFRNSRMDAYLKDKGIE
jgi:hypothetical protein